MSDLIIENNFIKDYQCFRIPGIIRTGNNSLIVYYECRKDSSDWAQIDIGMKKSSDGGLSWSERRIIISGNGKTVNNPVMIADKDKLMLLWQSEYITTYSMESFDDGETWCNKRCLDIYTQKLREQYDWTVIAFGPGHGTVLKSGRYVVPAWICSNHNDPHSHHPSKITMFYSDDKGITWDNVGVIDSKDAVDPNETALAELSDGSALLNIRITNTDKCRALAYEREKFDVKLITSLADPVCEGSMVSYNNILYFVNCNNRNEREHLTLKCSVDDGKTWNVILEIDQYAGYSDIAINSDGKTAFVIYEGGRQLVGDKSHMKELVFTKINI